MKATSSDVAMRLVQAEFRDPEIAQAYAATLNADQADRDGQDKFTAWLKSQGYNTTPDAVYQAFLQALNQDLSVYDSLYATSLNGATGPVVLIQKGFVSVNGQVIDQPTYTASKPSWQTSDKNPSTAVLHLSVLPTDDGKPLPAGS